MITNQSKLLQSRHQNCHKINCQPLSQNCHKLFVKDCHNLVKNRHKIVNYRKIIVLLRNCDEIVLKLLQSCREIVAKRNCHRIICQKL